MTHRLWGMMTCRRHCNRLSTLLMASLKLWYRLDAPGAEYTSTDGVEASWTVDTLKQRVAEKLGNGILFAPQPVAARLVLTVRS